MPTQLTHAEPGHHWLRSEWATFVEFTVHNQVTLVAPTVRNTLTT